MNQSNAKGPKAFYGWYSQRAVDHGAPTFIYRRENGEEVELTSVTPTFERSISARTTTPDAVYMGVFAELVRGLRPSRQNRSQMAVK